MKKPTRLSLALLISAGALSAALSAPAVFAEDGHGGHRDGRGSDDVAAVTTPAMGVDDSERAKRVIRGAAGKRLTYQGTRSEA